ncbi:MFS transporter [Paeniglutamicibacter sp. NPDC012692]|uniref:MFS transporter n=1 Tax=Paeniglutamicibacter sp. NPDC012692 TaxID=3364388 RepID=UPI00368930EE
MKAPNQETAKVPPAARSARTGGLARYVAAATLARTADGGAVVAVVLLVTTSGGPGWLAGLLGASITAPHLLGPFVARRLDTAADARNVIAFACVAHGGTLAAAVLLYPFTWPLVPALFLMASGLFGPFLTGGISSRLPEIAGDSRESQRRAQGWDVATYGMGGTIGPGIVAAVSAWAGATVAALILAAGTMLAAVLVRQLPRGTRAANPAEVPKPGQTLLLILGTGPLRRTLYMTMAVALSVAVLPITAVASTGHFRVGAAAAAILTAAYGLGNLAGSIGVMIRPPRGDADKLMTRLAFTVAGALLCVAFTTAFGLAIAAYALAGIVNAYFFAATLAARSEYAPQNSRGQVFVWVGALKITAGSAGTALAGAVIADSALFPLHAAMVLTTFVAACSFVDRRSDGNPVP